MAEIHALRKMLIVAETSPAALSCRQEVSIWYLTMLGFGYVGIITFAKLLYSPPDQNRGYKDHLGVFL
jgi:hypothetical protein